MTVAVTSGAPRSFGTFGLAMVVDLEVGIGQRAASRLERYPFPGRLGEDPTTRCVVGPVDDEATVTFEATMTDGGLLRPGGVTLRSPDGAAFAVTAVIRRNG
jgi:hypothetical protein